MIFQSPVLIEVLVQFRESMEVILIRLFLCSRLQLSNTGSSKEGTTHSSDGLARQLAQLCLSSGSKAKCFNSRGSQALPTSMGPAQQTLRSSIMVSLMHPSGTEHHALVLA